MRTLTHWMSLCVMAPMMVAGCSSSPVAREASLADIQAYVAGQHKSVLTFAGYSGAGYDDEPAMLAQARQVLDAHDPATTLVNIGATEQGIGAVYALAKRRGFTTIGIVSVLARDGNVKLSPHVDVVFYVADSSWGGLVPATDRLAPTSEAIVATSHEIVAIGGGDIARDEMLGARHAGKAVTFIPADMDHDIARSKARKKGDPEPMDFHGAAHAVFKP